MNRIHKLLVSIVGMFATGIISINYTKGHNLGVGILFFSFFLLFVIMFSEAEYEIKNEVLD